MKGRSVYFKQVRDWDNEAYWLSNKRNNGEFDYWFVLGLMYMESYVRDYPSPYHLEIMVVAPSQVPEEDRDSCLSSLGLNDEELETVKVEELAVFLAEDGLAAPIWDRDGTNKRILLEEARKQAQIVDMFFGFFMDKFVNQIGTTGWDMIKGDILAGARRWKEEQQ